MKKIVLSLACIGILVGGAACSNGADAPDTGDTEAAATARAATPIPAFESTNVSRTIDVDGISAKQFLASDDLNVVLGRMNKFADGIFVASSYTLQSSLSKDTFESKFNCHAAGNNTAYPLMFRAGGPDHERSAMPGAELNGYTAFNPESERMGCSPVNVKAGVKPADAALAVFKGMQLVSNTRSSMLDDKTVTAAARTQFNADAALVVQSLIKEQGKAVLYKCHWDNTDDTDADALMTIDYSGPTTVARVVLGWVQP